MLNVTLVKTCTLTLVPDVVTYIMCVVGIITITITFVTNLLMALYFHKVKRRLGGVVFYRSIIYISMFACLIGRSYRIQFKKKYPMNVTSKKSFHNTFYSDGVLVIISTMLKDHNASKNTILMYHRKKKGFFSQ